MADPFAERSVTLSFTSSRGHTFKLLVKESVAVGVIEHNRRRAPHPGPYNLMVEHNEGVACVDLAAMLNINATIVDKQAKREFVDLLKA